MPWYRLDSQAPWWADEGSLNEADLVEDGHAALSGPDAEQARAAWARRDWRGNLPPGSVGVARAVATASGTTGTVRKTTGTARMVAGASAVTTVPQSAATSGTATARATATATTSATRTTTGTATAVAFASAVTGRPSTAGTGTATARASASGTTTTARATTGTATARARATASSSGARSTAGTAVARATATAVTTATTPTAPSSAWASANLNGYTETDTFPQTTPGGLTNDGTLQPRFRAAQAVEGAMGLELTGDAFGGVRFDEESSGLPAAARTEGYLRWYTRRLNTTAGMTLAHLRVGQGVPGQVRYQDGLIYLREGFTNRTSFPAPAVGEWMRLEWRYNLATRTAELRCWTGANLHGPVDAPTHTITAPLAAATVTQLHVVIGTPAGQAGYSVGVDALAVGATWQGPQVVSTTPPPTTGPTAAVTGAEAGAVTTTAATLVYDLEQAANARAVMSASPDLSSPVYGTTTTGVTGKSAVTSLPAGARVYWGVEVGGALAALRGSFAKPTPSFKAVVASCAGQGTSPYITNAVSNAPTFEAMRAVGAALWVHPGDRHYHDPGNVSQAQHVAYQAQARSAPRQRDLLGTLALAYHPDDHELSNNWTGATTGAAGLLAAMDAGTAHYPYAVPGTWAHTWTWGRVRFVMLDSRSKRVTGSILGTEQHAWLDQLLDTCTEPVVVLDTNVAYIGDGSGSDGTDGWGAYPASQRAVGEAITRARARGTEVMVVAGDAHMVAMDDGTNSQYDPSQAGVKGPRVCQFGPMDSAPSIKGGPYSLGVYNGSRYQFGVLDVTDDGSTVTVTATGYRVSETAPYPATQLVTQTLTSTGQPPTTPPPAGTTDPTTVVQSANGGTVRSAAATSLTMTLPSAPAAGRLLTALVGIDKNAGTIPAPPAGWTALGAPYVSPSVTQVALYRVADGTAADRSVTVSWSTSTVGGARGHIAEWGFAPTAAPTVATFPNPAADTAVTALTGNAGSATGPGLALAAVSVDTANDPWGLTWSTPWKPVVALGSNSQSGNAADAGGASIGVAALALTAGTATDVTATTGLNDQTTLRVARFAGTPA